MMSASFPSLRVAPASPRGTTALTREATATLTSMTLPPFPPEASMTAKSPTLSRAALPSFAGGCPAAKAARDTADAKASTSNFLCILMEALLKAGKDEDTPSATLIYVQAAGSSTSFHAPSPASRRSGSCHGKVTLDIEPFNGRYRNTRIRLNQSSAGVVEPLCAFYA